MSGPNLTPITTSQWNQWKTEHKPYTFGDKIELPKGMVEQNPLSTKAKDALVGGSIGAALYTTYASYFAGLSANAAASLVFSKMTQAANTLVVGGTLTMLGTQVIVATVLTGVMTSVAAIAARKLPTFEMNILQHNCGGGASLEFFGELTPELNKYRKKVYDAVLPKSVIARSMPDPVLVDAMRTRDSSSNAVYSQAQIDEYRETLMAEGDRADLARTDCSVRSIMGGHDFIAALKARKADYDKNPETQNVITDQDIQEFEVFLTQYGDSNFFKIMRSANPNWTPTEDDKEFMGAQCLLKLENAYLKNPKQDSQFVTLNGKVPLPETIAAAKKALFDSLFTLDAKTDKFTPAHIHLRDIAKAENFAPANVKARILTQLDFSMMKKPDGVDMSSVDIEAFADLFSSVAGQLSAMYLYHATDLQLANDALTKDGGQGLLEVNKAQEALKKMAGTPKEQAIAYRQMVIAQDARVLGLEECPPELVDELTREPTADEVTNGTHKRFFSPLQKDGKVIDGTTLFLREDTWEPGAQVVPHTYRGDQEADEKKLALVLATEKRTKDNFLLAVIHGSASKAADGLGKVEEVLRIFKKFKALPGNKDLQLIITMDANTKKEVDENKLKTVFIANGMQYTDGGPNTIKVRAVTSQTTKAGQIVSSLNDFIATMLSGYKVTKLLVGGLAEKAFKPLPSKETIWSDHYPLLLTIQKQWSFVSAAKYFLGVKKKQTELSATLATFSEHEQTRQQGYANFKTQRMADAKAAAATATKPKSFDERKDQKFDGDQFTETKG